MGKILSLVLGLAVVAFLAYRAMYGRMPGEGGDGQAPAQQLEGVKNAAKRIEGQGQENADKAFRASEE
jgi:hypothetical protein